MTGEIFVSNIPTRHGHRSFTYAMHVACPGDIVESRECKVRIIWHDHGGDNLKNVGHFTVNGSNGGMAFPEVLQAMSKLFAMAAEHLARDPEGRGEIDFQI